MNSTKNTVLITGGSAGIGFEIAKSLTEKGNHVIITGRDQQRLVAAAAKLTNVTAIAFDVTDEVAVDALVNRIKTDFPNLNVLINNAGSAYVYDFIKEERTWEKAAGEIDTNYISIIRLTEKLLPQLLQQENAAVVNVSSIVAIVPNIKLPSYSFSKAALHSYTMGLRLALKDTSVKIFELMPPLVATDFSAEIGGLENGIPAAQVASELITALEKDEYEIHVGGTAQLYNVFRTAGPEAALNVLNGIGN